MTSKILDRTSCRNYLPKSIPAKIIRQFKNIINSSPTAINAQPFSAIFITNKKMINELIKFNFNQTFITQTPLVVLFLADLNRVFHNIKMENGSM
jgi:nitroreductase